MFKWRTGSLPFRHPTETKDATIAQQNKGLYVQQCLARTYMFLYFMGDNLGDRMDLSNHARPHDTRP